MSEDAHRYLIAYDVPDDRRRARLAKELLTYGDRIQYSVFVADCKAAKLVRLRRCLEGLTVPTEDSILICDLGVASAIDPGRFGYIGVSKPITSGASFVV